MTPPAITVVMPMYNNAREVRRAIDSVLAQTMDRFELIVVNDGSTDGCERIVREMRDGRIRLVEQKNKGVSAARNRGIAGSRSELIAFLDADDEWKPDFLETIVRLQTNFPECSLFATHYVHRELDGSTRSPILRKIPAGEWEGVLNNYFEVASHSDPPLWSSAVAVKRLALDSVGGFPEGVGIGEDLLTWTRLALQYKIAFSKRECSIFWLRGPLTGYPTRTPEFPDRVGTELLHLAATVGETERKALNSYISMWHRMRASMFIQLNDRANAMAEVSKMAEYGGWSLRVCLFFLFAGTPQILRKFVVQFFTFVKTVRRRIS